MRGALFVARIDLCRMDESREIKTMTIVALSADELLRSIQRLGELSEKETSRYRELMDKRRAVTLTLRSIRNYCG